MSDELMAGTLAGTAPAEETGEGEILAPSTDPRASEQAAEAFAEWTEETMAAEADAYAQTAGTSPDVSAESMEAVAFTASGADTENARIKAIIEAVIYITDEPLTTQQIAQACGKPIDEVKRILDRLADEYAGADRGLTVRELAGGYKMSTKPEHHEEIRAFVKNVKPPLKLSLAALETLAVIAYKQPITAPEIMDIRGVQGAGVLKTLLDRKLIATAGRKHVVGKPILYKSTREFLVQFGLKDLTELPTLKEFEELGRLALTDSDGAEGPIEEPREDPPPVGEPGPDVPPVEEPPPDPDAPEAPDPPQRAAGEQNA